MPGLNAALFKGFGIELLIVEFYCRVTACLDRKRINSTPRYFRHRCHNNAAPELCCTFGP
jgi:hypothetical protein